MVRGKSISSVRTCNTAALPRTWFLCFLLSSIIEVVVYFHEFHQKPTTLDGDGIVISTAHLMSEQWHVSAISVKYREKYLKAYSNMESLLIRVLSSRDVSSQMDYMKENYADDVGTGYLFSQLEILKVLIKDNNNNFI